MIRGLCLMTGVCLIPALFKLAFCKPPIHGKVHSNDETIKRSKLQDMCKNVTWRIAIVFALCAQLGTVAALVLGDYHFSVDTVNVSTENGNTSIPVTAESGNQTWRPESFLQGLFGRSGQAEPQYVIQRNQTSAVEGFSQRNWLMPLTLLVLSFVWWENFVDVSHDAGCERRTRYPLTRWKIELHELRQKATILSSACNLGIILGFPYLVFDHFSYDIYVKNYMRKTTATYLMEFAPATAQVLGSAVGYYLGSLACKLSMQRLSFSVPLLLSTPVTATLVLLQCRYYHYLPDFLPGVYVWHCPEQFHSLAEVTFQSTWQFGVCLLWWISQFIVAGYIWWPKQNPMDSTEK